MLSVALPLSAAAEADGSVAYRSTGRNERTMEATAPGPNSRVRDNPSELRYELLVGDDVVGEILYRLAPDAVVLVHTEVSPSLEGKGLGAQLVADALDDIRARGLHVVPICPFVRSYIRRHPEYRDLVVRDAQVTD
jgi:predicted GNAT family acetyltransferase